MKNIAIIGLGHVTTYQISAIQTMPNDYNIIALCDKNKTKLEQYTPLNCLLLADYSYLFYLPNIDVVLISLPNALHFEVSKAFLEKGIDVIVEKPAVLKYEQLDVLYKTSSRCNSKFYVAFHARFAADLLYFKENLTSIREEFQLGELNGFSCNFFDPYYKDGNVEETKKRLDSLSSSWVDSGVNALSVVYSLFDNLSLLSTQQSHFHLDNSHEAAKLAASVDFLIDLDHDCIGRGTINTNWTNQRNYKETNLFFRSSSGYIKLNHTDQQVQFISGGVKKTIKDFSKTRDRLLNHYINLFEDYSNNLDTITENKVLADKVHYTLLNVEPT